MSYICTAEEFNRYKYRYEAEPECIAWNELYEIWVSAEAGQTTLTITENGEVVDESQVYSWKEAEEIIEAYIGNSDEELEIEAREFELSEATEIFVSSVVSDIEVDPEVIEDCKEHFLEYMYRKFGLSIHRPMVLEDEEGEEFFEEYPYECMEFEDAPLY